MAVLEDLDEDENICSKCQTQPRGSGVRNVWCKSCKSEWQREYRSGAKKQYRVPPPVIDPETNCWNFQGYIMPNGYGLSSKQRGHTTRYAHRIAYEKVYGLLPETLVIDHLCSNRRCVNFEHLEAVTLAENTRRGVKRAMERRRGSS